MNAAGLEGLAAEAERIGPAPAEDGAEGGALAEGQGGPAAPVVDPMEANRTALCMVVALLREATAAPVLWNPPLRTLAEQLPDERLPALAEPWARVLTHYGVNLGDYGLDHPIAAAIITTGPVLWGVARSLSAELAARNAANGAKVDQAKAAA